MTRECHVRICGGLGGKFPGATRRDLERYSLIGTAADEHFERIVELAGLIFGTPIALIFLVERQRQWFLCRRGLEASETPREQAFCAHAITADAVMVVPDARSDSRFCANPLVTGAPFIRFYAGAPLHSRDGHNLGTVCVIDQEPRQPTSVQLRALELLSELVMREIELRHQARLCPITGAATRHTFLEIGALELQRAQQESTPLSLLCLDIDNLRLVNNRWGHTAGDQLLRALVDLLAGGLREQDYLARLGDGEFALLLVGQRGDQALVLAEQLRQAVTAIPGAHRQSDFQLHISGGLTSLAPGDRSIDDLLRRADQALSLAKGNGRNQIASLFAA
ncbi:MAG: GGDEF domain-containing protein [Cyanobium sp.]